MKSPNVTRNIDCLPLGKKLFVICLLRLVLIRNLLTKFEGISEQSSNVTMSPVPDPPSFLVLLLNFLPNTDPQ